MKEDPKKRVAVVSEDQSTAKLIDLMLKGDDLSVEILSSSGLGDSAGKQMPSPSMIIYDYSKAVKEVSPLCHSLKKYPQYDKTPRVVISTFNMECDSCPDYKVGKCGHIQKPFHLDQMRGAIDKLVK